MTLVWECDALAHCIIEHHQGYLYLFTDAPKGGKSVDYHYLLCSPVDDPSNPRTWEVGWNIGLLSEDGFFFLIILWNTSRNLLDYFRPRNILWPSISFLYYYTYFTLTVSCQLHFTCYINCRRYLLMTKICSLRMLTLLINTWHSLWGKGVSFGFVQLASHCPLGR